MLYIVLRKLPFFLLGRAQNILSVERARRETFKSGLKNANQWQSIPDQSRNPYIQALMKSTQTHNGFTSESALFCVFFKRTAMQFHLFFDTALKVLLVFYEKYANVDVRMRTLQKAPTSFFGIFCSAAERTRSRLIAACRSMEIFPPFHFKTQLRIYYKTRITQYFNILFVQSLTNLSAWQEDQEELEES